MYHNKRRFQNPDMNTCWLNACLQLVLLALDYDETFNERLVSSELGRELLKMKTDESEHLNPLSIKEILVDAEDTRIATK